MSYAVKECFLTLQGEGVQSGRRAVFLRFAGCNLWTGREQDREAAQCNFCDTDFVGTDGEGGGKFADAAALAETVAKTWGEVGGQRLVVITGGEPMLQLDPSLVEALHERGFEVGGFVVAGVHLDGGDAEALAAAGGGEGGIGVGAHGAVSFVRAFVPRGATSGRDDSTVRAGPRRPEAGSV